MEPELTIPNKIGEFINIVCFLSLVEPRFYTDPLKSLRCVHDMSVEVEFSGRRKTRWKKKGEERGLSVGQVHGTAD